MDIHQILKKLPQRYPFLLVDRVLAVQPGKSIKALKNVTINESHFVGHFPHRPVMPGVMMLEAMAQTAALLVFADPGALRDPDAILHVAGMHGARFKRPVEPGDQLVMYVEIRSHEADVYKFKGTARVGEDIATEVELTCTMRTLSDLSDLSKVDH